MTIGASLTDNKYAASLAKALRATSLALGRDDAKRVAEYLEHEYALTDRLTSMDAFVETLNAVANALIPQDVALVTEELWLQDVHLFTYIDYDTRRVYALPAATIADQM